MIDDNAGKDLFKLFNNAVCGKTMENLRKRINFEVVTSRKIALKRIARPNFQRAKIFREDLVGIHTDQAGSGDESSDFRLGLPFSIFRNISSMIIRG